MISSKQYFDSVLNMPTVEGLKSWADASLLADDIIDMPTAPSDPVPTGTIYYFAEGTTGTGDGSINNPFETLDEMRDTIPSLSAGDAILFAMGDTFKYNTYTSDDLYVPIYNVNGTINSPIIFGRYWKAGDEANTQLPKLTGITTKTYTWTSVGSGIYTSDDAPNRHTRMLKDGVEQIFADTLTKFNDWDDLVECHRYDTTKIYHRHVGTLTELNNSVWTFSDKSYLINLNGASNIIFNGIAFEWSERYKQNIWVEGAHNITIQNCEVGAYSHEGLQFTGESVNRGEGFIINHNKFDTMWRRDCGRTHYILSSDDLMLHNLINLAKVADNSVVMYNEFIDFGHVAITLTDTNVDTVGGTWTHNRFYAPNSPYARPIGSGVYGTHSGLEVAYNDFNECSSQSQLRGTDVHWHHNIFRNHTMSNKSYAVGLNPVEQLSSPISYECTGHIIENNIFYNLEMPGLKINGTTIGGVDTDTIVRNNIFYNCSTNMKEDIDGSFRDWRGVGMTWMYFRIFQDDVTGVTNNNLFFDDTITEYTAMLHGNQGIGYFEIYEEVLNTALNTVTTWESFDNISSDPLFVNTTEFKLNPSSPAIGTGTQPTATVDYDGNTIAGPTYNIGLYTPVVADSTNPYLESFTIPAYVDTGDDTDGLINLANGRYNDTYINREDIDNFYIEPEDYLHLDPLNITTHGTEGARKTISLYNGNDLHPAQLTLAQRAVVQLKIKADWWIADRMYVTGGGWEDQILIKDAEHCIVNRMYAYESNISVAIGGNSHYATIQNSRFEKGRAGDGVAVNIMPVGVYVYERTDASQYNDGLHYKNTYGDLWDTDVGTKHYSTLHCKVINNEFVDQNDGFQATVTKGIVYTRTGTEGNYVYTEVDRFFEYGNVGGLVVNDNDFYLNYTADRENATDTKCGTPDPDVSGHLALNSISNLKIDCIISQNRCWGYDGIESNMGESGQGNSAIIASMYSPGYKIYDNIVFDSVNSIGGGSNSSGTGLFTGRVDSEIYNNISYRCGREESNLSYRDRYNVRENNGRNLNMHDDYFIEPKSIGIGYFGDTSDNSYFTNNKVVEPMAAGWEVLYDDQDPEYTYTGTSCDQVFKDSVLTTYEMSRAGFTNYKFYKDKFTNDPIPVTLYNILDPNGTIVSPE